MRERFGIDKLACGGGGERNGVFDEEEMHKEESLIGAMVYESLGGENKRDKHRVYIHGAIFRSVQSRDKAGAIKFSKSDPTPIRQLIVQIRHLVAGYGSVPGGCTVL